MNLTHNSLIDDEDESDFEGTFRPPYDLDLSTNIQLENDDTHVGSFQRYSPHQEYPNTKLPRKKLKVKKLFVDDEDDKPPSPQLVPVNKVCGNFPLVFNFKHFNKMQSAAFDTVYNSDNNCVVSAPTGSGKTVLFELAIIRYINKSDQDLQNKKALYIAPTKSLCFEVKGQWTKKFPSLTVSLLTGDSSSHEIDSVKRANIIIATPEKWDLLTRKWTDYNRLFELVQLVLADEIHTIGEQRGATLEAVLTRMNTMGKNVRIIGISATVPNILDISRWLRRNDTQEEAVALKFDDSFRQVELEKHVIGYNFNSKNDFQRDAQYNQKVVELIVKYSKGKPVLIFCPTRASTVSTAKCISDTYRNMHPTYGEGENIVDNTLKNCINSGVAFHHAGLILIDRTYVENSFLNGQVTLLCATSTLAVGVNLPAYLVIIKGTKIWSVSEQQEYSNLDIQQMIGRAGRPQFEKKGCALIMTEPSMVHKYENLISGSGILESMLHLNLREHICAEISLSVIKSVETAVSWIKNTFFYIRYCQNKSAYREILKFSKSDINESLTKFCEFIFNLLLEKELISNIGSIVTCTPFGHAMVKHYITFKTISTILNSKGSARIQDILETLANSEEFNDCRVRHNEKRLYKEINTSPLIRYPFLALNKQSLIIDQINRKVSLIIQYELGGLEFPNYEGASKLHHILVQDKTRIFKHSFRILRCMIDCHITKKDGISLESCLFLLRSLNGSCWEDSPLTMRQVKNIGLVSVRKLVNNNVTDLGDLQGLSDQKLENYLGLKFGAGMKIKRDIDLLPDFSIRLKSEKQTKQQGFVNVSFKIEVGNQSKTHTWCGVRLSLDITTRFTSGLLLDFRRIFVSQLLVPKSFRLEVPVTSSTDDIEFSLNCQEIAGLGKHIKFSSRELMVPKYPVLNTKGSSGKDDVTSKCLLDDYLSSSSDDSLCDYLVDKVKKTSANHHNDNGPLDSDSQYFQGRKQIRNGNFECHHSCNQKGHCRHLCCQEGIPKNMIKKRKNTPQTTILRVTNNQQTPQAPLYITAPHIELGAKQTMNCYSLSSPNSPTSSSTVEHEPEVVYTLPEEDQECKDITNQSSFATRETSSIRSNNRQVVGNVPTITTCESISCEQSSSSAGDSVDLDFLGSDIELL